ncbi:DUF370 domain-containing protein [Aneurinibacillus sp. Ricciae_BoGa-3]|uniref:extracellular matrix regulator RemB n=1 Tax=Aneurinibacillus sp. Ricciae_BoGa-3 TaxID=3022697 RepID=UPI00234006D5|nr:DUF370 domain-containing protein [Aneurinibacillus sp. Ricciae_BoGa-3]WCK54530.1 DUF370 domain-containing protein [Aneurinibacillus sp. Ricciae_BoGa-3]
MFIHLGGDIVVRSADVITILDSHAKSSKITRQFIETADAEGRLVTFGNEECKSYVITKDNVYMSPISSLTLKRRANFVSSLESR